MTDICKLSCNEETIARKNKESRIKYDREILLQHECVNPPEDVVIKLQEFFSQLLGIQLNNNQNKTNGRRNIYIKSKEKISFNNYNKENLNNNTPLKQNKSKLKNDISSKPLSVKKSSDRKPSPINNVSLQKKSEEEIKIEELDNIIKDQEPEVDQSLLTVLNKGSQPASLERRLEQREKQIQYGYNTEGYKNYIKLIPKDKRKKWMPKTPNKYQDCSKRSWDGQVRAWRRALHQFDNIDNLSVKVLEF